MRFRKAIHIPAVLAVTCTLVAPVPVKAEDGRNTRTVAAAVAAAALIGIAASGHHHGHYSDRKGYDDPRDTAEFDRGYRDALHDADRNNYNHTVAYREGYKAGEDERDRRIDYNQPNRWESDRHVADSNLRHRATVEAEKRWNIAAGNVTPTRSYKDDNGNYRVIVEAGYLKGECSFDRYGSFVRFEDKWD